MDFIEISALVSWLRKLCAAQTSARQLENSALYPLISLKLLKYCS